MNHSNMSHPDQRQMMIDAAMEIGLTQDEAEDAVDVLGSDIEEFDN